MKKVARRYSVNQQKHRDNKLKITPSQGSQKDKANKSSDNSFDDGTGLSTSKILKIRAPKSEKSRSIKTKRNYMSLMSDELEDRDIVGARKTIALYLQSNFLNTSIVILIITYCFITFIFTSVPPDEGEGVVDPVYHSIESIFILLFVVEFVVYKFAFKQLYFTNKFNMINFILILVIIFFWILDIAVKNYTVSILLRSRGVMRLMHVPTILQNIQSHLKLQRGMSMHGMKLDNSDRPTSEKVIEILLKINESLDDPNLYNDMNYWIKHIASGKLYDAQQKDLETEEVKAVRRRRGAILQMEEHAWIKSCTNIFHLKRDSNDSGTIIMATADNRSLESILDFKFNVTRIMEKVDMLEFDIFAFKKDCNDRELTTLTSILLHKHSLYSGLHIPINKFILFMDKISSGYNNVKYHNKTHATDVVQTLYYFIMNGNWITTAKMDNIDICSMLMAAAVHDYEHPGYNNMYMINTRDTLAVRYNDISVLENHHIASSSSLMKLEKYNIFSKLAPDDSAGVRKRMVHMVLSTDMSKHFTDLGTFKQRVMSESFDPADKDKLLCMGVGIHLSDISNPTKHWDLTLKWTELLFEEFFKQGDKEREMGLRISDLMDRTTTNIAKAQLGFIDVIVLPAYENFAKYIKWWSKNIKNMKKNRETWANLVPDYHKRMEDNINLIIQNNEIIEEAKSENEEDSESNKLSSFDESTPQEYTLSDEIHTSKEYKASSKKVASLFKQRSTVEKKESPFIEEY